MGDWGSTRLARGRGFRLGLAIATGGRYL